ncbi:MAG: Mur ligase family protein, partial [Sphingobacterium sp.]
MSSIAQTYYPQTGRLVILGAGESGVGAAILGQDRGFDVLVSDRDNIAFSYRTTLMMEGIAFEERGHSLDKIYAADLVVKSPGIPATVPVIIELRKRGIPVISEIEFAAQYTDAKLICITGSNGKTTTSMLTYRLLWDGGIDVGLAGNIGHSFALQVARSPRAVFVLEISSFMLDDMY